MYNFPNNLFVQYVDEGCYLGIQKKFAAINYMYMIRNKTFNLKRTQYVNWEWISEFSMSNKDG